MMMKAVLLSQRRVASIVNKAPVAAFHALAQPVLAKPVVSTHDAQIRAMSAKKQVQKYSWAAEKLTKMGETLADAPQPEQVFLTTEIVESPPAHILDLSHAVLNLNVVEINQLIKSIHNRIGMTDEQIEAMFSGGGAGGADAAAAAEAEKPKEKDSFGVKISAAVDAKSKIKVIKEVRAITGLGLKEAKELVEKAPCVLKEGLKKEEAEALQKVLVDAGAAVELV